MLQLSGSLCRIVTRGSTDLLRLSNSNISNVFISSFRIVFHLLTMFRGVNSSVMSRLMILRRPLLRVYSETRMITTAFLMLYLFINGFLFLLLSGILLLLLGIIFFLLGIFFRRVVLLFRYYSVLDVISRSLRYSFSVRVYVVNWVHLLDGVATGVRRWENIYGAVNSGYYGGFEKRGRHLFRKREACKEQVGSARFMSISPDRPCE